MSFFDEMLKKAEVYYNETGEIPTIMVTKDCWELLHTSSEMCEYFEMLTGVLKKSLTDDDLTTIFQSVNLPFKITTKDFNKLEYRFYDYLKRTTSKW